MSRGLALNLLASALTILATFAFLLASTMGGGSPLAVPARADTRPIVHAFYDAINAVLRTGDPAALDAIVAPDFTMHGAFVAVSPDRAGLARQLVATSAVAPDLQLEVEDLAVADERALVHLEPTSGSGGAFLGMPFATTPAFWGGSKPCASKAVRSSSCGPVRSRCRYSNRSGRPGWIPSSRPTKPRCSAGLVPK